MNVQRMNDLLRKSPRTDFNADVLNYALRHCERDAPEIFDYINQKAVKYAQSGLTLARFVDKWKDERGPIEECVPEDPALKYFQRLVADDNTATAPTPAITNGPFALPFLLLLFYVLFFKYG